MKPSIIRESGHHGLASMAGQDMLRMRYSGFFSTSNFRHRCYPHLKQCHYTLKRFCWVRPLDAAGTWRLLIWNGDAASFNLIWAQSNFLIYKTEIQNVVYNCARMEMHSSSFQERRNLPTLHGSVLSSPTTEQGHFSLTIRQSPLQSSRGGGGPLAQNFIRFASRSWGFPYSVLSPISLSQAFAPPLKHLNLSLHLQRDQRTQLSRLAKRFVQIFPKPERTLEPTQCYNADCFQVVKVPENRHLCTCVYLTPGDTHCVYT